MAVLCQMGTAHGFGAIARAAYHHAARHAGKTPCPRALSPECQHRQGLPGLEAHGILLDPVAYVDLLLRIGAATFMTTYFSGLQ